MELTDEIKSSIRSCDWHEVRKLMGYIDQAERKINLLLDLGRIDDAEEVSYDAMVAMHKLRILANAHKEVSSWTRSRLKA
nr:MAG TPA: hypothetical protein [Caudoviricetes sp.]